MANTRILIADDSDDFLQSATLLLSAAPGITVVGRARSGEEAVAEAERLLPDLVLMDVHMPGMDGLEATREIRRLPGDTGRVPVIALTASVMRGETEQCLAAGMDALLPKPIDPIALATALSRHARPAGSAEAGSPTARDGVEANVDIVD